MRTIATFATNQRVGNLAIRISENDGEKSVTEHQTITNETCVYNSHKPNKERNPWPLTKNTHFGN